METISSNHINWLADFGIVNLKEFNELDAKDLLPESFTTNCYSCGVKFKGFLKNANLCNICLRFFCNSCITKIKSKFCKNCLKLCQEFNGIIGKNLIKSTEKKKEFIEMIIKK